MNPAEHFSLRDAVADFFFQIKSHAGIDNVVKACSPSAQGIRCQPQELSIASCHEAAHARSKFLNIGSSWKEIRIVDDSIVSSLRADDCPKPLERLTFGHCFVNQL